MGDTVTLSIESERRTDIPFAVIPYHWVRAFTGKRKFSFLVPQMVDSPTCPPNDNPAEVTISIETGVGRRPGQEAGRVILWLVGGAEHLLNHPQVATYPEARAKIVAGMN